MDLSQKPVWLFSSGPTNEGDLEVLLEGWKFPWVYNLLPIGFSRAILLFFAEQWTCKN